MKNVWVNGIKCPYCAEIIFSRSRHDFKSCSCKKVAIDGGFEYIKVVFYEQPPINVGFRINNLDIKDLYDDYNSGKNKYGRISKNKFSAACKRREVLWYISNYQEIPPREI